MCSGCSGDYAGGFDSDDPDDPMADGGDGAASTSFRGTSETDLGETDLAEGTGGGTAGGTAGLEVPEDASENCEILVSGTHIVEIRVISANSRGQGRSSDRSSDRSGDQSGDRFWNRREALPPHAPGKHSSEASAKYYQTRRGAEKTRGDAAHSLRISRSFAGACKAKLNGWLQQTRRLVRRCTPQSS